MGKSVDTFGAGAEAVVDLTGDAVDLGGIRYPGDAGSQVSPLGQKASRSHVAMQRILRSGLALLTGSLSATGSWSLNAPMVRCRRRLSWSNCNR